MLKTPFSIGFQNGIWWGFLCSNFRKTEHTNLAQVCHWERYEKYPFSQGLVLLASACLHWVLLSLQYICPKKIQPMFEYEQQKIAKIWNTSTPSIPSSKLKTTSIKMTAHKVYQVEAYYLMPAAVAAWTPASASSITTHCNQWRAFCVWQRFVCIHALTHVERNFATQEIPSLRDRMNENSRCGWNYLFGWQSKTLGSCKEDIRRWLQILEQICWHNCIEAATKPASIRKNQANPRTLLTMKRKRLISGLRETLLLQKLQCTIMCKEITLLHTHYRYIQESSINC